MAEGSGQQHRNLYLAMFLLLDVSVPLAFKYLEVFNESLHLLFDLFHLAYRAPVIDILLPIGILFYTLKFISYTLGVFKCKIELER